MHGDQADVVARGDGNGWSFGRQDRHAATRLRPARRAGQRRCGWRLADEGRDLRHAEGLVELEAGDRSPRLQRRGGQRLPGAEPVPQRSEPVPVGGTMLQDLAVEAGHGGEDGGAQPLDQPRPDGGIGRAGVDRGGRTVDPGVGEPDAQRVGPVERAGVQHAIVGMEPLPALVHRSPAPGRAMRVQDALGSGRRSRGVDEEGRVLRCRVGEVGEQRAVVRPGAQAGGRYGPHARRRVELEPRTHHRRRGARVLEQEPGLGRAEQRRGGQRDQSRGQRAEEGQRAGGLVAQAQQQAVARAQA